MPEYTGPSLSNYLLVLGFLALLFVGFYYIKKNKHLISKTINSKRRMKVSEVTMLGQGDRALILNLDNKDYLFISGKNSGSLLTEIKNNNIKTNNLEKVFEKRLMNEKISLIFFLILLPVLASAQITPDGFEALTITESENGTKTYSLSLKILALMTALTVLPSLVLGMTAFTRIIIVMSILRQALGTQQTP